jgi:hypothetical protein
MAKYKCENCGHDHRTRPDKWICRNCNSGPVITVEEEWYITIFNFLADYKIVIGSLVVLLLLISLIPWSNQDGNDGDKAKVGNPQERKQEEVKYAFKFTTLDKSIKIEAVKYNDEGNVDKVSDRKITDIINKVQLEAEDDQGRKVKLKNGKLYPCPVEEGNNEIVITWKNHLEYPLKEPNSNEFIAFELDNQKEHPEANCKDPLRIKKVKPLFGECLIKVFTNRDDTPDSSRIRISVSGKNGNFRAKRQWNVESINEYQVFATINGDTANYIGNGNPIGDCNEGCNDKKRNRYRTRIVEAGQRYLDNPDKLDNLLSFQEAFPNSPTKYASFTIRGDNSQLNWSDFTNEVPNNYDNIELKVDEVSVIEGPGGCRVAEVIVSKARQS